MTSNRLEQTVPSKHDLEDHIDQLRELDELRIRSAELRNKGLMTLEEWIMKPSEAGSDAAPLNNTQLLIRAQVAATLYRLSRNSDPALLQKLKEAIDGLTPLSPIDQEKHHLPVMVAANNFHVLVSA